MKTCTVCKEEKVLTEYYNLLASKDKKSYRCKNCDNKARRTWSTTNVSKARLSSRKRNLKYKYDMSIEEYEDLLSLQNGGCGICDAQINASAYGKNVSPSFSVDHDHTTLRVRGLLCNRCNRAIGLFNDNVELLTKAVIYLADPNKSETH